MDDGAYLYMVTFLLFNVFMYALVYNVCYCIMVHNCVWLYMYLFGRVYVYIGISVCVKHILRKEHLKCA